MFWEDFIAKDQQNVENNIVCTRNSTTYKTEQNKRGKRIPPVQNLL